MPIREIGLDGSSLHWLLDSPLLSCVPPGTSFLGSLLTKKYDKHNEIALQHNEPSRIDIPICSCSHGPPNILPLSFQIQIALLNGKTMLLWVHSTDLVKHLSKALELRLGIPSTYLRILHEGKQLEDPLPLSFYNIEKDASVNISLRL